MFDAASINLCFTKALHVFFLCFVRRKTTHIRVEEEKKRIRLFPIHKTKNRTKKTIEETHVRKDRSVVTRSLGVSLSNDYYLYIFNSFFFC